MKKQTQFKPNTKPIQTQSNPICGEQSRTTCSELACPACPACPEPAEGSLPALSLVEVSNQSKGSNLFLKIPQRGLLGDD